MRHFGAAPKNEGFFFEARFGYVFFSVFGGIGKYLEAMLGYVGASWL